MSSPSARQLTGRVQTVHYRDPESRFTVAKIEAPDGEEHTIVGNLPALHEGEDVTVEGDWTEDSTYGKQFAVDSLRAELPGDLDGLRRYLASDQIRGIGEARAGDVIDKFGDKTLDILNHDLDRLTEIEGIGDSTIEKIRKDWSQQQELRELHLFLETHELPTHIADSLHEQYGDQALTKLKEEPYQLSRTVEGIGFKTADRIARSVQTDKRSSGRFRAGLRHALDQASDDGHTYLERDELLNQAAEVLDLDDPDQLDEPLANMVADGELQEIPLDDDTVAVTNPGFASMRQDIVNQLKSLLKRGSPPDGNPLEELATETTYTDQQRQALRKSLEEGVLLITGGPGTGKTTVVDALVKLHESQGRSVKLAAPTGRAAQRLEETSGHEAQTIHRLLGYQPPGSFKHGPDQPLGCDTLVVDEVSMVDLWLFHRLVQALSADTTLVLVGDPDQLPSVGPGNILQDLLASDRLPRVHLDEIFRQARESDIVANAHRINQGEYPDLSNEAAGDCFFLEVDDPATAVSTVQDLAATRLPDHYDLNPREDLQVLAPMYRGTGGVNRLNEVLQERLNPGSSPGEPFESWGFRNQDRVMQLRNNYDKDIFNGDIGQIIELDHSTPSLTVQFPRAGTVELEPSEWEDLQLAYAATIHKSQGSEYPAVILVLLTSHYVLLQRNLLYTALTRAEDLAVIVGQKQALGMAINNDDVDRRNTLLDRNLRDEISKSEAKA